MVGQSLAVALVAASALWPVVLGAALVDHLDRSPRVASVLVYVVASRVCHQRLARSFVTEGVKWPVCGRCAGLYLSAPIGAAVAIAFRRRCARSAAAAAVVAAAVPTAATVALEWLAPSAMTSMVRMGAALPLGAVLGFVLVSAARGIEPINRVH